MDTILQYRGRTVSAADVELIQEVIATYPGMSRRRLSVKLCEAWDWRHQNVTDQTKNAFSAFTRRGHWFDASIAHHSIQPSAVFCGYLQRSRKKRRNTSVLIPTLKDRFNTCVTGVPRYR